TFYEGFVWQPVSVAGVVISLIGNLVIFAPPLSEWRIRSAKAANDPCS
ncbi:MAG: EamA family transporter, partial [Aeromonas veronii]